eukprot:104845_1
MGAICITIPERIPTPICRPALESNHEHQHLIIDESKHERTKDAPLCYCGRKLRSDTFHFEFDWRCSHCFEKYHKNVSLTYWCYARSKCTFTQVTNLHFIVCPSCYDAMVEHDGHSKHNIDQFFLHKIRSQTQYIRNVIIPKNQRGSKFIGKYCEFMYAFFFQQFICRLQHVIVTPVWDQIVEEFHDFYNPIRDSKLYT